MACMKRKNSLPSGGHQPEGPASFAICHALRRAPELAAGKAVTRERRSVRRERSAVESFRRCGSLFGQAGRNFSGRKGAFGSGSGGKARDEGGG